MTREEAREYFEHHMRFYCVTGVCREAEEMAIAALSAEPCEDTISRQAAIEEIRFGQSFITKIHPTGEIEHLFDKENKALEAAVERIEALPSVTPKQEPKTGQWIKYRHSHKFPHVCSVCGEEIISVKTKLGLIIDVSDNFCPNCGAKMESEADNDKSRD